MSQYRVEGRISQVQSSTTPVQDTSTITEAPIGAPTGAKGYLTPTGATGNTTDLVIREVGDLINQKFLAWYKHMYYLLGRERFFTIASVARADGKDPKRLFSTLLKKAA